MATIHLHQTTTATPEQGPAQAEARNYQGQAQS